MLSFSSALAGLTLIFLSVQPAQGASWVTNGPMNVARYHQTGTLLPNGTTLVAGGYDADASSLASAELFDPANGTWALTGNMNDVRSDHTATMLPNGQVLVSGGYVFYFGGIEGELASAELFDPATGIWTITGPMADARVGQTATLLPDGEVLVAGGGVNDPPYYLNSAEVYNPATGSWTRTGNLNIARAWHTATLMPDGQVLVVGGQGTNECLFSAELYDPSSGTWTVTTNSLNTARMLHTATLLPNGQVLVAGGFGEAGVLSSAELFDPNLGTWTPTPSPLNFARGEHTATLLPNGQVLVAGGYGTGFYTGALSSAELYDPSTGIWAATSDLTFARGDHTATMLPSGKMLITGGYDDTNGILASVELYDSTINPATGTWTNAGVMNIARKNHTATLLPNGQVLISGGDDTNNNPLASAELYNPANETSTSTGAMSTTRDTHTATLLTNGKVLVTGGNGSNILSSSELYDPTTGTWTNTGAMNSAREAHTATLLTDGKVLVAGGYNGNYLSSAELYDPVAGIWINTGILNIPRQNHTATLLPNGQVLVTGGLGRIPGYPGEILNNTELYDPATGTWMNTGVMNTPRVSHTATLLLNGQVLVTGGFSPSPLDFFHSSAELYDPFTGTWTLTGEMNTARDGHTATLLSVGKVLVAGGYLGIGALSSAELYDPANETWTTTGIMNTNRSGQTATLLPNGHLLILGGFTDTYGNQPLSSVELYDAGLGYSNSWQPQITSTTAPLNLGGSLAVTGAQFRGVAEGSSGNTQDSSADYPLVQLRNIESGQTTFLLVTNWSTNSVTSTAVWNFPPGYALATVFVNGIQSTSAIVNISVPMPAATTLNSAATLNNGQFQFSFTNSPGALFGVLATTNLSLPLTNWTKLGGVTEVAPGQFQFSDPQATNGGQRYYNLFAP